MDDRSAEPTKFWLLWRILDSWFGIWFFHFMALIQRFSRPKLGQMKIVEIPRSSGDGAIRTWVVAPRETSQPLPIVLHLHGGGYAIGAPYQDFKSFDRYLAARPCIFVAPQYRRSVQAPFPAALDDAYDTLLWVRQNAKRLGGREDQIFVMGESAGGGLAAGVALLARDRAEVAIAALFPFYAMLDDQNIRSTNLPRHALTWSVVHNRLAWTKYLDNADPGPVSPYAAPSRASDLSHLPPSYGLIGQNDLFLQENKDFFDRLDQSGVPVRFKEFEDANHGIEQFSHKSETGRAIWDYCINCYSHAVDTCFAKQP